MNGCDLVLLIVNGVPGLISQYVSFIAESSWQRFAKKIFRQVTPVIANLRAIPKLKKHFPHSNGGALSYGSSQGRWIT